MRNPLVWLITDTHWNMDFKEFRPKNYGDLIISNCRKVIAKQDTLIHLGDVINDQPSQLKNYLDLIPATTKILVRGNHDTNNDTWYINKGFNFVCDQLVMKDILLSHIPQPVMPKGVWLNIHGHFHDNPMERCFQFEPEIGKFYNKKQYKLLAMEYTNYSPVGLDDLLICIKEKIENGLDA